jgi:ABC-type lipoprotein release transport system permease subunit
VTIATLRRTLLVLLISGFSAADTPTRAQPLRADASTAPVLVSRQLAARAHVAVGDVVTLATDPAGGAGRLFRVVGIYEPTPDPMRFTVQRLEARLHLPDLIDLTADPGDAGSTDKVDSINVRLVDPYESDRFADGLRARMPGLDAGSTSRPRANDPFPVLDRFHLAISLVTVAGSTAFLLALMIIRAEERKETVGAMRLLGISRRSLLLEVAIEGLLIAAAGAVFGALIAYGAGGLVNRIFQSRYDTTLVFVRVTRSITLRSFLLAVPLGVAAGIAASWTLLRRTILSLVGR